MWAVRVHALERAPSIAFLRPHQAQLAPVRRGLPADCERTSLRPAWCVVTNEKVLWFRTTVSRAPQHNEAIMALPLIHFGPVPLCFPLPLFNRFTHLFTWHAFPPVTSSPAQLASRVGCLIKTAATGHWFYTLGGAGSFFIDIQVATGLE